MTLLAGARLGAYEIVSKLGAGGMGEVYRARDTRLDRTVAIKVLREDLAHHPERRARFEREARVLSQLTHPNICTLHDVGEHDGVTYLVLELLNGETLADRLQRAKPRLLPLNEVFAIAIDVADALAAAHRSGIVHRDLKPSNVVLTKSAGARPGSLQAKLLDFGIAKATAVSNAHPGMTQAPTLGTVTLDGALVGTIQYMAPEQLEGRDADARSDLFAFGAMLYEMLTGRRAFDGESQSKVIAAVLDRDPPPIGGLQPLASPALVHVVQKCLAKDQESRWQSASDVADELRWVRDAGSDPTMPVTVPPPLWRRAIPVAIGVILTAVLAGTALWGLRSEAPPRIVSRFTIPLGEGQRFPPPVQQFVAISPDGTQIAYAANNGLYVRSMSEIDAKLVPGTDAIAGISNPIFSPDGRSIVFYSRPEQALKKIAVTGGVAVTLCATFDPFGVSWGPSDILFGEAGRGADTQGILRISADGGKPELLIPLNLNNGDRETAASPQMLPDNETVLFTLVTGDSQDRWDRATIVAQSLKSGKRTTLIEGGSDGRYVPSGHIVYARGGVLYATRFDARQLRVTGGPVPILEGVNRSGLNGVAAWSLANNGTLVYARGPAPSTDQRGLAVSDRQGVVEPLKVPPGAYQAPRVSPDGKAIAVTVDDEKEANIWLYDVAGTLPGRRLTYGGQNRFAIWSPDGGRLAFQSDREGDQGLFWQLADGTGTAERLTKAELGSFHVAESFSPDGEHLLVRVSKASDSKRSVIILSLKDMKTAPFLEEGTFSAFSPDGRWVAYTHREGTSFPLAVQPFPATGAKYQVWAEASRALWSRDGKELFAMPGPRFEVVTVAPQPTFGFSRPVRVGPLPMVGAGPLVVNYDIMPDGQHFLILTSPTGREAIPQIQVVLNWLDELKRRVAER